MRGVHTDDAIEYAITRLERFFARPRRRSTVLRELRDIGAEAQQGFPALRSN